MKRKRFWTLVGALGLSLACAGLAAAQPTSISACGSKGSGSYVLTQDISTSGDCLTLTGDNITIDLAGFTISGDSTGSGITDAATIRSNIAIRNGTITNFFFGINLGASSVIQIDRMRAVGNGAHGIVLSNNSSISNSIANNNGSAGIGSGDNNLISGNTANGNGLGISTGSGSIVSGNIANGNGGNGIEANNGSTVSGNTAKGNGNRGLSVSSGSDIVNNTARNNGTGIQVGCPSNLVGNTAKDNGTNLSKSGSGCKSFQNLF